MLINDLKIFVSLIPTSDFASMDGDESRFEIIRPFLEESEISLKNDFLGDALYKVALEEVDQPQSYILHTIRRVIAVDAYYRMIPFVDLIQTPNGFAVTSNTNLAPASKERVERLLAWLKKRRSDTMDQLVDSIMNSEQTREAWSESVNFKRHTECLFMTAITLQQYGNKDALREDLSELHPVLLSYQAHMGEMISQEYLDELIDKRRTGILGDVDLGMIFNLQTVLGCLLKEDKRYYHLLELLVNGMHANLDKYPTYAGSQTYRLRQSPNYENKKEHRTFFFSW